MEDNAQLLRGGARSAQPQALKTTTQPNAKWKPVIYACLACSILSFIFGVNVGYSWRDDSPEASRLALFRGADTTAALDPTALTTGTNDNANDYIVTSSSASSTTLSTNQSVAGAAALATTPCATPAPKRMSKPRRKTIVLLGDSITMMASEASSQGFALRLSGDYVRGADVLNRGVTVYNTKGYLSTAIPVLEDEIATWLSPSVIAVWFGVNDAAVIGGEYQSQHVPVENYKNNLITMLQRLQKAAPDAKIILMTPMTVDNARRLPTNRNNEETGIYAAACREVMNHVQGVTLLDMYKYMMEKYPNPTQRGNFLADGLHLSTEGHRVTYELLKQQIERLLPGFSGRINQVPEWETLNDKYPRNAVGKV